MERGDIAKRRLDRWLGIPLTVAAGAARPFRRLFSSQLPPEKARSVAILCLGAIGDLLLASALIAALRKELPGATLDVMTTRANAGCHGFLPGMDNAYAFAVTDVAGMAAHLRAKRYDLLFDTSQWARLGALLSALSGAGIAVGFATKGQFRHYAYDFAVPHRDDVHETENFLALGKAVFPNCDGKPGILLPDAPSHGCPECLRPHPGKKLVLCHMWPSGLKSYLKEWPAPYWAELANALAAAGYVPVFTGGPQDAAATGNFMREYRLSEIGACSVAGTTSLADLAWSMRHVSAVVSVNTGVMHLAAIAGVPTVALNGPTNSLRWGPVGEHVVSLQPRSGRFGYLNLGFEYPEDAEPVLKNLPADDVITALRGLGLGVDSFSPGIATER